MKISTLWNARSLSRVAMVAAAAGLSLAWSAPTLADEAAKDEPTKAAASKSKVNKLDEYDDKMSNNPSDPNAKVVYFINCKGEIGSDVSATSFKKIMADAKKVQPDFIVLRVDSTWDAYDQGRTSTAAGIYGSTQAQEISMLIIDEVRDSDGWTKKPQLVAWVKKAFGPAAFLPFLCPKIYYTPDAIHGGIGGLDSLHAGRGDLVVREKLRGAGMGRAEGLAIKGGHDPRILRAMARVDYVLSYDMVGGKPDFKEDMSGKEILTDTGIVELGHADTLEDLIRMRGNDVLTLRPEVAERIGFIDGVAGSYDDLMFELGINRAYKTFSRRPDKIMSDWRAEVDRIIPQIREARRKIQEIRVQGNTPEDRIQARNKYKRLIQTQIDVVSRYKEIAGTALGVDPDQFIDEMRQQIAELDRDNRLERR